MNLVMALRRVEKWVIDDGVVGFRAKQIRKALGKTLKEMSTAMKLSVAYLSSLERGDRKWSVELICKFNKAVERIERKQVDR